jgi:serine/threonine protein kinase
MIAPLAFAVTGRIAAAIAYMHTCGWAHRDVKAENVLFDAQTGAVKLIDLGYASKTRAHRISEKEATEPLFNPNYACASCGKQNLRRPRRSSPDDPPTMYQCMACPFAERLFGKAVGTPIYMALEILDNKPHSAQRADVYALGVLACVMFFGSQEIPGFETPATVDTLSALRRSRRTVGIPIPVGTPGIDTELELLLRDMTNNRPAARPVLMDLFKSSIVPVSQ